MKTKYININGVEFEAMVKEPQWNVSLPGDIESQKEDLGFITVEGMDYEIIHIDKEQGIIIYWNHTLEDYEEAEIENFASFLEVSQTFPYFALKSTETEVMLSCFY